jgi:hypothetical protein
MSSLAEIVIVSLVGLAVTSSNMIGAALGLYLRPSKQLLACILAFAAGALITALAIELAYEGRSICICVASIRSMLGSSSAAALRSVP